MNVTVLGAGAWGTAVAVHAGRMQPTVLWGRTPAHVGQMQASRCNDRYLPAIPWPSGLRVTDAFEEAVAHGSRGLILVATPMAALDATLRRLPAPLTGVLWLCKGFEAGTGRLGHEIARSVCAQGRVGVLSGPSFALEVAQQRPTALVAASADDDLNQRAVQALHGGALRIYTSADPIGVEVGGAVKNVLAIATGVADGMGLGLNARAALVTRGLAEMTRLGLALGARAETFQGLSGLGDLVLTTTGDLSRNRTVGLKLAEGLALPRILQELGHVAEGVTSAGMVLRRARELDVEMPITEAVAAILDGLLDPRQALLRLMERSARAEG